MAVLKYQNDVTNECVWSHSRRTHSFLHLNAFLGILHDLVHCVAEAFLRRSCARGSAAARFLMNLLVVFKHSCTCNPGHSVFRCPRFEVKKGGRVMVKMISMARTGYFYNYRKNPRRQPYKLMHRRYDPFVNKHVIFVVRAWVLQFFCV